MAAQFNKDNQEESKEPIANKEENKGQKVDQPSVAVQPPHSARSSNTSQLAMLLKNNKIDVVYQLFWYDEENKLQLKEFDVLKQATDHYRKLSQ